jgi:diguanylate cyclase (GGDEF)-like protein
LTESFGPSRENVGLVIFDIDHFKRINDTRGHSVGDEVIVLFARTLTRHLRPGQMAARLGGDEFVLVDRHGGEAPLVRQAEDIRRVFTEDVMAKLDLVCTVTGGMAAGKANADGLPALLGAADRALYHAKRQGRDRLAASGPAALVET